MLVNCGPARRCVWPVLAPAEVFVRAGAGRRGVGEGRKLPDFAMPCRRETPFDLAALDISPFKEGVAAGGGGGVLRMAFMSQFAVFYISFGTHTGRAFLSDGLAFVSRLLFAAERQTGRLARGCVSIPRGSGSPLVRSRMACGYPTLLVHFGLVRFFAAIPTGDDRSRLYEKERRVGWAFLLIWFADSIGYRGENAGAARPRLRQRAIGSLDSLHLGRGRVPLCQTSQ